MKKKVMIWLPFMKDGGFETVLISVLNHIDYDKFDITVLLTTKTDKVLEQLNPKAKLKYIELGNEYLSSNKIVNFFQKAYRNIRTALFLKYVPLVHKFVLKEEFDVEVAWIMYTYHFVHKSPNKNSRKIAWMHSDIYTLRDRDELVEYLMHYDDIISVSKKSEEQMLEVEPRLKDKCSIIYNPVDVEKILAKGNAFEFDYKSDVPVFSSMGRLAKVKGYDLLIQAHARLIKDGYAHQIKIFGKGPLEQELRDLIQKLGVQDTIELMGFKLNPMPYVKASDYYIISSISEPYGMVLPEAFILGLPAVVADGGGVAEMVIENKNSIFVEATIDGLYKGMKEMLTNKELEQAIRTYNQDAPETFNPIHRVRQIEQAFSK